MIEDQIKTEMSRRPGANAAKIRKEVTEMARRINSNEATPRGANPEQVPQTEVDIPAKEVRKSLEKDGWKFSHEREGQAGNRGLKHRYYTNPNHPDVMLEHTSGKESSRRHGVATGIKATTENQVNRLSAEDFGNNKSFSALSRRVESNLAGLRELTGGK